jgi:hypothetical protein
MTRNRTLAMAVAASALLVATSASASPWGVVKESGRTAGHAIRDGGLTVGRTIRDFFIGGPHMAERTWNANAGHTSAQARRDTERVKAEARE